MNIERATEVLTAFTEAVSALKSELSQNSYKIKRLEGFEAKFKELEAENKRLKQVERKHELLRIHAHCEICPQCDGQGGFSYDLGEQGGGFDECKICSCTGLVDKIINP